MSILLFASVFWTLGWGGTCNLFLLKMLLVCGFSAVPIVICFYVRVCKANKASLFCPIQNPTLLDLTTCSANLFVQHIKSFSSITFNALYIYTWEVSSVSVSWYALNCYHVLSVSLFINVF